MFSWVSDGNDTYSYDFCTVFCYVMYHCCKAKMFLKQIFKEKSIENKQTEQIIIKIN